MTIREWITSAKKRLIEAGCQCADLHRHSEQILEAVLGVGRVALYMRSEEEISSDLNPKLEEFLKRRCAGEPFQYIIGYEYFWNSKFHVGPGVLIPRKETEHIVEAVLKISEEGNLRVAELGAGSGNIGISVLKERPEWEWHAFEKNPESLAFLKRNIEENIREHKYHLHAEDFFGGASKYAPYDLVVSNPPYVSREDLPTLAKEVQHEPKLALDGGEKGLEVLEKFSEGAKGLLSPQGVFISEIGSDQETSIKEMLIRYGFGKVHVLKDYAGLPRVAIGVLLGSVNH